MFIGNSFGYLETTTNDQSPKQVLYPQHGGSDYLVVREPDETGGEHQGQDSQKHNYVSRTLRCEN